MGLRGPVPGPKNPLLVLWMLYAEAIALAVQARTMIAKARYFMTALR
jgi:hypothetical protein